jgi:hypothetical protein
MAVMGEFDVIVGAGTLRGPADGVVQFPHRWTGRDTQVDPRRCCGGAHPQVELDHLYELHVMRAASQQSHLLTQLPLISGMTPTGIFGDRAVSAMVGVISEIAYQVSRRGHSP